VPNTRSVCCGSILPWSPQARNADAIVICPGIGDAVVFTLQFSGASVPS